MIGMGDRVLTGRHVLIGVLAFFGIVIAANGVFIFLALDSFSGLSVEDPYQRGLAYNEILRAAEAQRSLGWRTEVEVTDHGQGRGRIEVAFRDRRDAPVEDLRVTGMLRRPTHDGFDRELRLERSGPGRYGAAIDLPVAGQWALRLSADSPGGARFELEDVIWLK